MYSGYDPFVPVRLTLLIYICQTPVEVDHLFGAENYVTFYVSYDVIIDVIIILVIRSVSDVLRAQSRFVKFVGGEAAGRTPYTFYKPTLGPKYVRNRPNNEFITQTTFIQPIISIFNGFPVLFFDFGCTLDSKYAVT